MCIVNIGVKVVPNYSTEGGGNTPEVVCQLPKKDGHSQFSKQLGDSFSVGQWSCNVLTAASLDSRRITDTGGGHCALVYNDAWKRVEHSPQPQKEVTAQELGTDTRRKQALGIIGTFFILLKINAMSSIQKGLYLDPTCAKPDSEYKY